MYYSLCITRIKSHFSDRLRIVMMGLSASNHRKPPQTFVHDVPKENNSQWEMPLSCSATVCIDVASGKTACGKSQLPSHIPYLFEGG